MKILAEAAFFGIFVFGTFFWFEAEKEVRILCCMFHPDQPEEQVIRMLNTG